jgi:hypothetical protein
MARYESKLNQLLLRIAIGGAILSSPFAYWFVYEPWATTRAAKAKADQNESLPVREVIVNRPYELKWRERSGAPAVRLLLHPADFGKWRESEHPKLTQTANGPESVRLEIFLPNSGELAASSFPDWCSASARAAKKCEIGVGRLVLYRDFGLVQDDVKKALSRTGSDPDYGQFYVVSAFWVKADGAAWHFEGWDCEYANKELPKYDPDGAFQFLHERCHEPKGVAKFMPPSWAGMRRIKTYALCKPGPECTAAFLYQGRPAVMQFPRHRGLFVRAAVEQLERSARDAAAAPSADVQLQRAAKALANCEAGMALLKTLDSHGWNNFLALEMTQDQCGYAVQVAHAALPQAPAAAGELMLRAMSAPEYRKTRWDEYFREDVQAARAKGK